MVSTPPYTVAVVAPDLSVSGGVMSVVRFLVDTIRASKRYQPTLLSVALSSTDRSSVRLAAPRTWLDGVDVTPESTEEFSYQHVGAIGAEVEYLRYQPRATLTHLLNQADLVQVVAGTPAWAQLCRDVASPVALQVATLAQVERSTRLDQVSGPAGVWRRLMTQLTDRLDHAALRHIDVAFVENTWMEAHLARHLSDERVVFAPPGVDTDRFTPGERPSTGKYILSVGRFADPRKNVSLLFEAYAQLRDLCPSSPRLVLAGRTKPSDEAWSRAETLGIRSSITMHEDVSLEALTRLYQNAALYVVSSNEEGLGITILEAMASGRPVVSTDCGGPSTTMIDGETGFLTPLGDAEALARAMKSILSDPQQADRFGRLGRQRVEEVFSAAATGQRFLDVYDQLLAASS